MAALQEHLEGLFPPWCQVGEVGKCLRAAPRAGADGNLELLCQGRSCRALHRADVSFPPHPGSSAAADQPPAEDKLFSSVGVGAALG